jgi:hypothetical protein
MEDEKNKKMEDDLKKNGKQPKKWKTTYFCLFCYMEDNQGK